MRPHARRLAALSGLVLMVTGCGLPGSGPKASDAADKLATALSAGSVKGVSFVGGDAAAAKQYTALVGDLATSAQVSAGKVTTNGDKATARLSWSWKLGATTWLYQTDVDLQKSSSAGWQVQWSPAMVYESLKAGDHLTETGILAKRGDILGARNATLVTPRPVIRVGIDKDKVPAGQAPASAARLARLVGIDAAPYAKQVKGTGPRAFVQAIVYRSNQAPPGVLHALTGIRGAGVVADKLPLAPTKDFASAILGTVGPATAEIVKGSQGRVKAGDDVGLSGLEKRYDEQLAGTRGVEVAALDSTGHNRRVLFTSNPVDGTPVHTTIDPALQKLAQNALAGVGPASALVAIRPSTGDLVAVASGPGSKGYNTATYGRYAPGSTFKIVSTLALLRAGETPSTTVPCTPTTVVDGKQFKNYSDYPSGKIGQISLEDALANSCNTAFISQRDKLGATSLADAASSLGFGVDHDTGFPAYFGGVGPFASKTQAAASMIGQGTVLASPMAMATVVASVVKGSAVLPRLLTDQKVTVKPPAHPMTATEARELRAMMRAVVLRGSGARLAGIGGAPVIAKTGTAEYGTKLPLPTHAWMVAGHGDLAVAVFVDQGSSGSGTAGPILQQFLQQAH